MANKKIVLTEEECKVLVNMIDAAVRASGLEAAFAGAVLASKIQKAPIEVEPTDEKKETNTIDAEPKV